MNFFEDIYAELNGFSKGQWTALILLMPLLIIIKLFQAVRLLLFPYIQLINWLGTKRLMSFHEYWNNSYWENDYWW